MIDTVFGINVRVSGLCINWYRPIVRRRGYCLIGASLLCSNFCIFEMLADKKCIRTSYTFKVTQGHGIQRQLALYK